MKKISYQKMADTIIAKRKEKKLTQVQSKKTSTPYSWDLQRRRL